MDASQKIFQYMYGTNFFAFSFSYIDEIIFSVGRFGRIGKDAQRILGIPDAVDRFGNRHQVQGASQKHEKRRCGTTGG